MELSKNFTFEKDKKGKIVSIDTGKSKPIDISEIQKEKREKALHLRIKLINEQTGKAMDQLQILQTTELFLTETEKFECAFKISNVISNFDHQLKILFKMLYDENVE